MIYIYITTPISQVEVPNGLGTSPPQVTTTTSTENVLPRTPPRPSYSTPWLESFPPWPAGRRLRRAAIGLGG